MRLEVVKQQCAGHAICLILAPDLFELGPDNRAFVTQDPIPPHLEGDAEAAIAECPAQAIVRAEASTS